MMTKKYFYYHENFVCLFFLSFYEHLKLDINILFCRTLDRYDPLIEIICLYASIESLV